MPNLDNELTEDDFTREQWENLCRARLRKDAGAWYRLMRTLCGWTPGRFALNKQVKAAVDTWLKAHPSWTGRFM